MDFSLKGFVRNLETEMMNIHVFIPNSFSSTTLNPKRFKRKSENMLWREKREKMELRERRKEDFGIHMNPSHVFVHSLITPHWSHVAAFPTVRCAYLILWLWVPCTDPHPISMLPLSLAVGSNGVMIKHSWLSQCIDSFDPLVGPMPVTPL